MATLLVQTVVFAPLEVRSVQVDCVLTAMLPIANVAIDQMSVLFMPHFPLPAVPAVPMTPKIVILNF